MPGLDPAIHRKQGNCLIGGEIKAFLCHCEERLRRSNPFLLCVVRWIASRSLSSGAHSRDPLARNDGTRHHTLPFSASPISSSTLGSSMVAGIVHGSPSAIFLIVPRRIFPDPVFGTSATVVASLNAATGPSLSRTSATISFSISAWLLVTPAFSTRKPQGTSPLIESLMPSTAHSATSE